jgi:hypothetical protein
MTETAGKPVACRKSAEHDYADTAAASPLLLLGSHL